MVVQSEIIFMYLILADVHLKAVEYLIRDINNQKLLIVVMEKDFLLRKSYLVVNKINDNRPITIEEWGASCR